MKRVLLAVVYVRGEGEIWSWGTQGPPLVVGGTVFAPSFKAVGPCRVVVTATKNTVQFKVLPLPKRLQARRETRKGT